MKIEDRIGALVSCAIFDSYNSTLKKVYKDVRKERTMVWFTSQKRSVCEECKTNHGVEFDIDETEDILPLHPFCECFWVSKGELEK